jgi:ribose transport system substrate-binding protein
MGFPVSKVSERRATVALAGLLAVAFGGLGGSSGCKKNEGGQMAPAPGAAPAPAGGSLRFAFVTNNSTDFWNIGEKGLRKAEREFPNVKVSMFRPLKGEVADQQRFLEDIMVLSFDGVAISPINPDAMTGIFERVAAKMPLVTTDSDAPKSPRKVYVGTNNVEAGKVAGNTAADALKAAGVTKGKVALFVGRIDMQNAIERKKGIDETLGKVPGIEILPVFLDHTDRALAKKNVEDALARYPDLVLVMGIWSYNGPCAADAVRTSTRTKKPILVVFDEEEETLKGVQDGLISATIVQKPFEFGYQSIKALKEIKEGKTVPTMIDTGILVVNKANVDKFWSELKELKK